MTNREIAGSTGVSANAVRNYLREIFDVAGVWNRRELARFLLTEAEDAEPEMANRRDYPNPEPCPGLNHMTKPSMARTAR
jgi:hypothetical protein